MFNYKNAGVDIDAVVRKYELAYGHHTRPPSGLLLPVFMLKWGRAPALGFRVDGLFFPHWATAVVLALLAAYPTFRLIRHVLTGHRRRIRGLCLNCGYDLHGNESDVCPECGAAVAATGQADAA